MSQLFFLLPLANVAAVTLLHFRCLSYSVSMAVNLLCIGVLFYGIAMLILRLSGSATMAVLALLLYELLNEFAMSDAFVFYKVYGSLTVEIFCVRYVPLLVIALVCILLAFTTNGHAGRAAD